MSSAQLQYMKIDPSSGEVTVIKRTLKEQTSGIFNCMGEVIDGVLYWEIGTDTGNHIVSFDIATSKETSRNVSRCG